MPLPPSAPCIPASSTPGVRPGLTRSWYGEGAAWSRFVGMNDSCPISLPTCITAQMRTDGQRQFVFLLNFTRRRQTIELGPEAWR